MPLLVRIEIILTYIASLHRSYDFMISYLFFVVEYLNARENVEIMEGLEAMHVLIF